MGKDAVTLSGKIFWYPKPNSRITCILRNDEFSNKRLTDLLKKIVLALNISTDGISFGRVDAPFENSLLENIPDSYAIVFNPDLCPDLSSVNEIAGKKIYVVSSLQDMETNISHKTKTWETLKTLRQIIDNEKLS